MLQSIFISPSCICTHTHTHYTFFIFIAISNLFSFYVRIPIMFNLSLPEFIAKVEKTWFCPEMHSSQVAGIPMTRLGLVYSDFMAQSHACHREAGNLNVSSCVVIALFCLNSFKFPPKRERSLTLRCWWLHHLFLCHHVRCCLDSFLWQCSCAFVFDKTSRSFLLYFQISFRW